VRSTLMVFIQNQSPRRPRHHSVSLANAPSSSLLATPAPAVAHAWYSFRGGVVCPGVPWRAAASSQGRQGHIVDGYNPLRVHQQTSPTPSTSPISPIVRCIR
jgi:hypothetical protein